MYHTFLREEYKGLRPFFSGLQLKLLPKAETPFQKSLICHWYWPVVDGLFYSESSVLNKQQHKYWVAIVFILRRKNLLNKPKPSA